MRKMNLLVQERVRGKVYFDAGCFDPLSASTPERCETEGGAESALHRRPINLRRRTGDEASEIFSLKTSFPGTNVAVICFGTEKDGEVVEVEGLS